MSAAEDHLHDRGRAIVGKPVHVRGRRALLRLNLYDSVYALDDKYVTGQLGQVLDALLRYLVELAVQALHIVAREIVLVSHELRGERV